MNLIRRRKNSRFLYFRQRIPTDLVSAYGGKQEVNQSLGTSDLKEAKRLSHLKALEFEHEWEEKRKELKLPTAREFVRRTNPNDTIALSSFSDLQRRSFLHHVYLRLERRALHSGLRDTGSMDEDEKKEVAHNLRDDLARCTGSKHYAPIDWEADLFKALAEHGIHVDSNAQAVLPELLILFKAAHVESLVRSLRHLGSDPGMLPVDFSDPAKYYRDLGIGSSLPEPLMAALSKQRTITVKDLGESYYENQRESRITESTLAKTASEMSIMTQLWGGKTPITDLSRGHAIQLIDALKRMPTNGPKRYPGVSLEKMSELEEKKEKPDLISPKTVHNYFDGISSALRFATDEGWLERNPLSSRSLRKRLPEKQKTSKPMMTAADINQVFGSRKYLQERSNGARGEARFWVPILCLLHGVRSNEACQLLVEDVQEEDGIPFIDLRLANDDGEELKAFKTRASIRRIPLHDEIIKMGFLDFVEGQRIKGEVWLFPALSPNSMGSRADAVGKWFGRLRKELIPDLPEVKGAKGLHSFRHLFERTLRDQGVSDTLQYALGGWVDKKPNNSSIDYGGGFGVKVLKEAIDRVLFPGVDFSPLYGAP